ncbi:MAG: hypothetical protein KC656_07225, partial [Myxococcales bacterium]|nr:hypothetical protein [Myxococcales bacterium]
MRWLLPLVLLGCPIPSSRDPRVPDRVRDHAEACAEVLGPIPAVDCREGVRVQITADGEAVGGPVARCDAPSMLAGQCNPYSRVGRIPGQLADGSENPDVDFVFICRVEKDIEGDGPYGIVAMIGHDRATGGTCYFQASDDLAPRQVFPSPQRIPRTAPSVEDWVWQPPEQVAAQDCNT